MRWSGATGAIARCKRVSTECGRRHRSVPAWPWICGVKPTPKAVNTPSPHSIVHGLDKPGVFTTVSVFLYLASLPVHLGPCGRLQSGLDPWRAPVYQGLALSRHDTHKMSGIICPG